ncbi:MAG: hypothetical protein JW801_12385 [Bacteroidales bacterium]|nr:hypothetical protein [Bacteroidales bacterium]
MKGEWYKNERFWFYSIAVLSVVPFFFVKYVPSLDGPQHLYSVNLLKSILFGNDAVREYFRINPVIVGYWGAHFAIGIFHLFLPACLAEKFFIVLYLWSLYFSFRYLVKASGKGNNPVSFLIFPFALHHFFLLGYYTFSLGFSALFLFFGYLIRHEKRMGVKEYSFIMLLLLLVYLVHATVFAFTGLILILYLLAGLIKESQDLKMFKKAFTDFLLKSLKILLAAMPAIILFSLYYRHVDSFGAGNTVRQQALSDRLTDLVHLRLLHGFQRDLEVFPTTGMFIVIAVLLFYLAYSFINQAKKTGMKSSLRRLRDKPENTWLFIGVFLFTAYFFMPEALFSGNMVDRLGVAFQFILLIWLAQKDFPKRLSLAAIAVMMVLFVYQKIILHNVYIKINAVIAEVEEAGEMIPENTIYFPVNESVRWYTNHFICYAGVDKALISIKAPQSDGQFPVRWNNQRIPLNYVGDSLILHGFSTSYDGTEPRDIKLASYVIRFNDNRKKGETPEDPNMERILRDFYAPEYTSSGGIVRVYKLACMDEILDIKAQFQSATPSEKHSQEAAANNRGMSLDSYRLLMAIQKYAGEKKQH